MLSVNNFSTNLGVIQMSAKKFTPEQLERLAQIKKELDELELRTREKLIQLENNSNKLYCN